MKIAVTYENGMVFGHFGHTEQFKVYEVEDGKVVYEGTDTTCRDTQSTNYGIQYYWTVFAVNTEGTVSDSSPSTWRYLAA